jgi:hypothetical protein
MDDDDSLVGCVQDTKDRIGTMRVTQVPPLPSPNDFSAVMPSFPDGRAQIGGEGLELTLQLWSDVAGRAVHVAYGASRRAGVLRGGAALLRTGLRTAWAAAAGSCARQLCRGLCVYGRSVAAGLSRPGRRYVYRPLPTGD